MVSSVRSRSPSPIINANTATACGNIDLTRSPAAKKQRPDGASPFPRSPTADEISGSPATRLWKKHHDLILSAGRPITLYRGIPAATSTLDKANGARGGNVVYDKTWLYSARAKVFGKEAAIKYFNASPDKQALADEHKISSQFSSSPLVSTTAQRDIAKTFARGGFPPRNGAMVILNYRRGEVLFNKANVKEQEFLVPGAIDRKNIVRVEFIPAHSPNSTPNTEAVAAQATSSPRQWPTAAPAARR